MLAEWSVPLEVGSYFLVRDDVDVEDEYEDNKTVLGFRCPSTPLSPANNVDCA